MNRLVLYTVLCVVIGGCAGVPVTDAITQAEAEVRRADSLGMLWTTTEKLLADAKAAQQAGDQDKALALAQKAEREARLAQAQAEANATVTPDYSQ